MEKYSKFWFEGSDYILDENKEKLIVSLKYSLDKQIYFTEKLILPVNFAGRSGQTGMAFDRALQALAVIGGISYYKTCLPREMAGLELNSEQADFWKKVYERGLGEFFYQNKIDFPGIINFKPSAIVEANLPTENSSRSGALVALGGGKDSIVTAEILKNAGEDFYTFSLRDSAPIRETAEIVGVPRLVVDRQLDAKLFELNAQGALNGHVPITAYISALMSLCAIYYGFSEVIMSLEKSSNYGQFIYLGMDINHQYSKSEEFEGDFRNYLKKYVDADLNYFSLLRRFDELKICQVFTGLDNFDSYAPVFASCNRNFKINGEKPVSKWCGECPKCAFVYLCMAPFLDKEKLVRIFGQDLLDKADLAHLFAEILGLEKYKPFECVGTPEESLAAIYMTSLKMDYSESLLIKKFIGEWKDLVENQSNFVGWENLKNNSLKLKTGGYFTEKWEKLIMQYE